ncbi:MAG: transposase family protein [Lachnospiraceae bacterium]|nr:transposase family protein [Lachnospiraceae bacterium]
MDKTKEKFLEVQDKRHQSYVEHKLSDIMVITMCAVLCGIDSLNGIISYAENKKEFPENKSGITKIISRPALSRILNMADTGKIAEIITGIMKESIEDTGNVVAVDGLNSLMFFCFRVLAGYNKIYLSKLYIL